MFWVVSIIMFCRTSNYPLHIYSLLKHIFLRSWRNCYMKKQLSFLYVLLLLFGLSNTAVKAQTSFATEDELKAKATKLFEDDEFEEAYPLYSQLLSIYPKDANYNYRLGVCMLYASDDKEKAIPFLEFAAKRPEV